MSDDPTPHFQRPDPDDPRSGPPPGAVHELAERTVEYVRRALGLTLDYSSETLPVLDHYLTTVPRDRPETLALVASTAGTYFGEVVRKTVGGTWELADPAEAASWRLLLPVGARVAPIGLCIEAITHDDSDGEGAYDIPPADRAAVEEALGGRTVPEDEYFSLAGRLEAILYLADLLAARRVTPP